MIIVKLQGGLGNQLFQYALGRHLALKNKSKLKLDISGFKRDILREYALDVYTLSAGVISGVIPLLINSANKVGPLAKSLGLNYEYITEKKPCFLPEILEKKGNICLEGYWQSQDYFKDIRQILLTDLTLKNPLDSVNLARIETIKKSNSICVHVRRGDYVTHARTNKVHGTCSLDYYQTCISSLKEKVTEPTFFIFSDDREWVKNNLIIDAPCVYVDNNTADEGYKDLELMSYCKHFIIANSSFSWWGAWLSQNAHKLVYAPERWFTDPEILPTDIIPKSWNLV